METTPLRRVAALELMEHLLEEGFHLEGDRPADTVWVEPASKLTPQLRERIRELKPALMEVLAPENPEGPCECGGTSYVRTVLGPWRCARCTDLPPEEIAGGFVGPDYWREGG